MKTNIHFLALFLILISSISTAFAGDKLRCSLRKWMVRNGDVQLPLYDEQTLDLTPPQTIYRYSNAEVQAWASFFEAEPGVHSFEMRVGDRRTSSTATYYSLEKYHQEETVMNENNTDPLLNSYQLKCSLRDR